MRRAAWVALIGLGAVIAADSAGAAPFNRTDRNRDGVVDFEEARRSYPALSRAQFDRMDINRDGVIDRREYPQLDAIYQLLQRN